MRSSQFYLSGISNLAYSFGHRIDLKKKATTESKDHRVDVYISRSAVFARPILAHLRKLIHKGCPEVHETIKWGFPHFEYHGIICSIASFKHHCTFGFWKATLLQGYNKMERTAMGNFGKITNLKDLPPDQTLLELIQEASRINQMGLAVSKQKPKARNPLSLPPYFRKSLANNKAAQITFDNFPYSQQKEYVEWITEARTEVTRTKRTATAIEWLAEGKIRNWKYVR